MILVITRMMIKANFLLPAYMVIIKNRDTLLQTGKEIFCLHVQNRLELLL